MSSERRASVGRRRRTAIAPIQNQNARDVTFTKRRQGLFQKASELAVLCGAEVAILTFSPHDNPFSFGTPSADAVLGRFLGNSAAAAGSGALSWGQNAALVSQGTAVLGEARKRLKAAAGPGSERKRRWWEDPVEGRLGLEELEHFVDSMERMKDCVRGRLEEMAAAASSSGSVEKEEEVIASTTGSTTVSSDLDMMSVFSSIDTEEELVPRVSMSESFDDIWDDIDFGLYEIEQR